MKDVYLSDYYKICIYVYTSQDENIYESLI